MSATQPPSQAPGVAPFGNAHECKEWLGALPLTNIPHAQALVLDALRALNRAEFEPIERLKTLELLRDKVAFLQGEQRSRYFGKTLPLSSNDSAAWNTGRLLLEEMEAGYRACRAHAGADGPLHAHAALIAQRVMRYVGAQMAFHATIYRRFDPQLWTRLHAEYRDAEAAGLHSAAVKDSLESEDRGSSVMEAYAHVVLLQAAYLSELTAPQMDFVDALLRLWARKVVVRGSPAKDDRKSAPLAVDLEKALGARPLRAAEALPSHRVFDVEGLSSSLRKRITGLRKGDDAVKATLPAQAAAVDALEQMQRLHKLWCEGAPPRPPGKVPAEKTAGLAWGLGEIHFFISGGKLFEQPDQKRDLTSAEKQDMEVFGRVTERTHNRILTQYNFTVEPWIVVDEMLGAWRLQRPPTASRGVAIGRLLAMRVGEEDAFRAGTVSAIVQEVDGTIVITARIFPGRPEAVAVRAAEPRNRAAMQWTPALRLPAAEKLKVPASLVVSSGLASRGRQVELWSDSAASVAVTELLDRGTDFDRIATAAP